MIIPALGVCCLLGCAGPIIRCSDPARSDIPPAPWVQLEKYAGPATEIVIWIELDGSYKGHDVQTAFRGRLGVGQATRLQELSRDTLLVIYQSDALPTDGSVNLDGTADMPVYYIVFRRESADIRSGDERVSCYLSEGVTHPETKELLRDAEGIIAAARQS